MKVRAVQAVKYGSVWHLPGTPTECFDIPEVVYERLKGAVERVDPVQKVVEAKLPEDMPYRHVLINLGITTVEEVKKIEDLTALKGIGQKSAGAIREFLK